MVKSDQPCHLTEYNVKFKKFDNTQRRAIIRPPIKTAAHDAKMATDTTTGKAFIAHSVTPPAKKAPIPYQPPKEGMHTATEYKTKYLGKWQFPIQPIFPSSTKRDNTEPFNHISTHAKDYSAPPVTPRQLYKAQNSYEPPKNAFDCLSTAQTDFVDYGGVPVTPSLKPPPKAAVSTQPLEELTSYRSTFTTPTMSQKYYKPREVYVPPGEKFLGTTTHRSAFPKHPYSKPPQGAKPAREYFDHSVAFESRTTNRENFKAWKIPARFSRPLSAFVPPTEKVSDRTTSRSDYTDYGPVPPVANFKPTHRSNTQVAPLETLTTQTADFRAWDGVQRPQPVSQDKPYAPPQEKFDGTTTFKAHFRGTHAPRPPTAKPPQLVHPKVSDMDSMTSYKESFGGSGYVPCPSAPLVVNDEAASKFDYSHDDAYGHKYYSPKKGNETV